MAKTLANYDPLVQIPSGMTPAGADFPIVESHDILVGENDKRLDAKLDDIDSAIGNVGATPIATQLSSKVNTSDIQTTVRDASSASDSKIPSEKAVRSAIDSKTITIDSTVTQGSTNAVSGGAVHTQLATKQDALTFDTTPTASSSNPVTSGGVKTALDAKQDTLTFDTTPTASSSNPVTSGGVKAALDTKQNTLTYETTPIVGSVNPVTSTGIRNAIDTAAAQNLGAMQAAYDTFSANISARVSSLSNGMVACSNIAAETAVGDTRILLYTGTTNSTYTNGHWYYNSAPSNAAPSWTDGGAVGSAPTIDNTLTVEGAAANSKAVGDAIENIVTISNTQPGSNSGNKVWIKETTSEEVQIPTYEEHIAKANKADIATNNESDNGSGTITASKKYAIGDHFYINNTNTSSENFGVSTLYKATATIASGDAIVVGTNCEASRVVDEITSLSNDIDTVKADLDSLDGSLVTANIVQIDDKIRTTKGFFIDTKTMAWKSQSNAIYSIIKVRGGEQLNIVASSRATYIAVMKSYTKPTVDGTVVDYSAATGFTTQITVYSNSTYDATLPTDAEYLYIYLGTGSAPRTPTSIKINGYDFALPFFEGFMDVISEINSHLETIDNTIYGEAVDASDYSGLLSHIVSIGSYYISNNQTFTDRPQYLSQTVGAVMEVSYYASTIVKQDFINAKGQRATRLITVSTFTPHTTGMGVDSNGWFYNTNTRWANKKIVCFGDSRTWYDGQTYNNRTKSGISGTICVGYQEQMRILLGAILTNEGVSGGKSTQICDRIRQYDFSNFDAVLLEGGVNDYIKSNTVTIGEIAPIGSTFDTTTVYGAWQSAIEYLMSNYPRLKLFITVPAIAWDEDNTMGAVFPYDVASIKKEIATLYNLPVLDLYKTAGITTINRDTFYCDDISETGWRLHFNNDGNVLIGQIVAEYIKTH